MLFRSDVGSSYLPSELNVAYLYAQLEVAEEINQKRLELWNTYYEGLKALQELGKISLPFIPAECTHNGHMFYIKARDLKERESLIKYLGRQGIKAVFHYVPLHSSIAGRKYGSFVGEDRYTTVESDRLLRLPMFYALEKEQVKMTVQKIYDFYQVSP